MSLSLFHSPNPAYFTQFLSNPSSTLFCFFTCFLPPLSTPPSLTALRFLLPHHFITVFLNPSLVLGLFPTTGFLSPSLSLSASLSLSHSREDCRVFHFLFIPTLMIFPPNIVTFSWDLWYVMFFYKLEHILTFFRGLGYSTNEILSLASALLLLLLVKIELLAFFLCAFLNWYIMVNLF